MTQRLKECRPLSPHGVYVLTTSLCTWHAILTEIKGELRHIFLTSGINTVQTGSKYIATVTKSVYSSSHDIKYVTNVCTDAEVTGNCMNINFTFNT